MTFTTIPTGLPVEPVDFNPILQAAVDAENEMFGNGRGLVISQEIKVNYIFQNPIGGYTRYGRDGKNNLFKLGPRNEFCEQLLFNVRPIASNVFYYVDGGSVHICDADKKIQSSHGLPTDYTDAFVELSDNILIISGTKKIKDKKEDKKFVSIIDTTNGTILGTEVEFPNGFDLLACGSETFMANIGSDVKLQKLGLTTSESDPSKNILKPTAISTSLGTIYDMVKIGQYYAVSLLTEVKVCKIEDSKLIELFTTDRQGAILVEDSKLAEVQYKGTFYEEFQHIGLNEKIKSINS